MTTKNLTDKQLKIVKTFANDVYQEIGFDIPEGPAIEMAECVADCRRMEEHIRTEEQREAMEAFRALSWGKQCRIVTTIL